MKRKLSVFLAACMMLSLLVFPAQALHTTPSNQNEVPLFEITFEKISDANGDTSDTTLETGDVFWATVMLKDISTVSTGSIKVAYDSSVIDLCLPNGNVSTNAAGVFPDASRKISKLSFTDSESTKLVLDTLLTPITGTETVKEDGRKLFGYLWNKNLTVLEYDEDFNEYPVQHVDIPAENNKSIQIGQFRFKVLKMGDPKLEIIADDTFTYLDSDYKEKRADDGTAKTVITGTVAGTTYGGAAITELTGTQTVAVTAPVANGVPQSSVAAGTGYTGTISWNPSDASFGYSKVYAATVVLTADASHKFVSGATGSVSGATVTGNTISGDAAGNTLTFTATFPATGAAPATDLTGTQAVTVTAPVANGVPQSSVAAGTGYTGTISWNPSDASFGYSKVYAATVVLTADASHKFVSGATGSVSGATVTGNTISGDAAGNTLTFTATFPATGAATAQVPPPAPQAPSNGTLERPSQVTGQTSYTFTYKSSETGTPSMGTVTLKRNDNAVFALDTAVAADVLYTLTAAPTAGYQFVKWEKQSRSISETSTSISGTYADLNQCAALFQKEADKSPKLHQLTLSGAGQSQLLHGEDASKNGFESSVKDYKVYLLPGVSEYTLSMVIESVKDAPYTTALTVDGTAVTPVTTENGTQVLHTYTQKVTTLDGAVSIVLTDGSESSTYTLTAATVSNTPIISMDVSYKDSGVYKLAVNLENTIANAFSFGLKLDASVFTGFTDGAAVELPTESAALVTKLDGLFSGSGFSVANASYDATTKELTVALAATGYQDCTAKSAIGILEFTTADGELATAEELEKLTINANTLLSNLHDQRFTAFHETSCDGKTGLIRLTQPDKMEIVGYLNSLMKADVQSGKATITVKSGATAITTATLDAGRRFSATVDAGSYTLEIKLPNYKTLVVSVDAQSALVGAVALTAGDVTGDGTIDAADRTALLKDLFKSVTAGDLGDLDGNGYVDAGDLGYLLANFGK